MSDFNYQLLEKALDAASLRQKAISSNIANINTPGYKVNKVVFEDQLKKALEQTKAPMSTSRLNELTPEMVKRTDTTIKDNGNNVDLDLEMTEKAANEIYYNALITQLNAKYAMLNYVISN